MPASQPPKRSLVVLARAPERGCVKTRLAREIGEAAALEAYRELGTAVLAAVVGLGNCELVVAYTPAGREASVRAWLGSAPAYEPQQEGDLGARMLGAISGRCGAGRQKVVVIGTDCAELDPPLLETAFARLDRADAVFGPAADGGYYLVGMKRPIPELFRDIPWSAPDTLATTLARAAASGLSVALLEERRDVDTADDWRTWRSRHAGDQPAASTSGRPPAGGRPSPEAR